MAGTLFSFEVDIPGFSRRHVRAYEPSRLASSDRPLLVLFDGQNVFDDAPSFSGGWHAHSAVERLARNVPQPLVVAIEHGHAARISELSPFTFREHQGMLHAFLSWVTSWLLPHLRRHNAVSHDPRKITIGGSSMGGLAALFAGLTEPQHFGGVIAMSPSIWIDHGAMVRFASERSVPHDRRFYLDAGVREGRLVGAVSHLGEILRARGASPLLVRIDKRGGHREADWRRRLPNALRMHFGSSKGLPY